MNSYSHWKYTILLVTLLLVVTSRMAFPKNFVDALLVDFFSIILVVAAILTICTERHFRLVAFILGVPAIVLLSALYFVPREFTTGTQLAARVSAVVFLGFTVAMIVRAVVTARVVTWDTVVGAFSGYVLIGVVWTQIYCALDLVDRQAFAVAGMPLELNATVLERQAVFEYFSFATLSTVGYGNVTPVSQPAHSLAAFEAICGQFYLAVLVAGLIGIRTTGTHADLK